jgi:hypothetical protein
VADLQDTIDALRALGQDARLASSELAGAMTSLDAARTSLREIEDPAAREAEAAATRAQEHIRRATSGWLPEYLRCGDELSHRIAQ